MIILDFESSVTTVMSEKILAELRQIEEGHDVKIIFAIESGSRAWGFPSPDSDYDARFIYANRQDWYLTLTLGRDVIELPIDDELDINGWDIRKALNLMLKPNPVLLEWLSSPIRYIWQEDPCEKLLDLSLQVSHAKACIYHYLHMVQRQESLMTQDLETVNLRKYFYSLRPALVIRWIRERPNQTPPMNLQALMAGVTMKVELQDAIERLLHAKSNTRELGVGSRIPAIETLLADEKAWAGQVRKTVGDLQHNTLASAEELFRDLIVDVWR